MEVDLRQVALPLLHYSRSRCRFLQPRAEALLLKNYQHTHTHTHTWVGGACCRFCPLGLTPSSQAAAEVLQRRNQTEELFF